MSQPFLFFTCSLPQAQAAPPHVQCSFAGRRCTLAIAALAPRTKARLEPRIFLHALA